ncbi:hypothetical protein JCM10207_000124 [Rhodosporidiobolus poonsookiae]
MANPRQRRKMRSGTGKVKTSKQSIKNKNKVIVKGPAILAEAWDKNYAALGLLHSSNPRQAGGLEPEQHVPFAVATATPATVEDLETALDEQLASSDEEDEGVQPQLLAEQPAAVEKLKPGMARIVRDEHGNVVSIIVGGDNGDEHEEKVQAPERGGEDSEDEGSDEEGEEAKPWGEAMKDWSVGSAQDELQHDDGVVSEVSYEEQRPLKTRQGIPIGGGVRKVPAKSDAVRQLEQRASVPSKVLRHSSAAEMDWLVALVAKYGSDVGKMARDRKANAWQKTPGELKRMITKAGGFEELKARAWASTLA